VDHLVNEAFSLSRCEFNTVFIFKRVLKRLCDVPVIVGNGLLNFIHPVSIAFSKTDPLSVMLVNFNVDRIIMVRRRNHLCSVHLVVGNRASWLLGFKGGAAHGLRK
jgi:hypothetical protein